MSAFTNARFTQIQNAITDLYSRVKFYNPASFTHEDIYKLFFEEHHIGMLHEVNSLVGLSPGGAVNVRVKDEATGLTLPVYMNLNERSGQNPLPFPRYVQDNGIASTAPEELVSKWHAWVKYQFKATNDFSRIFGLAHYLNEQCRTPMQVRYVWPGVLNLIGMDPSAQEYVEQLRPLKVPAGMPTFSKELREYASSTAGRIAQATLLAIPEHAPASEAHVWVSYVGGIRVKCPENFPIFNLP